MYVVFFLISIFASLIGAICGVGGGIIIKPVLDATAILDVATVSFLSGCTVLSMTLYAVASSKIKKESQINFKTSTALSIGAILGGVTGKAIFQLIRDQAANENRVGLIQAICLIIITVGTLIYTLNKNKITTHIINNSFITAIIGMLLGIMSSFLGIGGGPINLVVLFFFFSMDIKAAAENSLYIILFSQLASLISLVVTNTIPNVDILLLCLMAIGGIIGGVIGKRVFRLIESKTVNCLFVGLMSVIILINIYNIYRFAL